MSEPTRLLILTQKVDSNDDVLGFFHGWVQAFSKKFSAVSVICLEQGETHVPEKVRVFSLGKEFRKSKIRYAVRFFIYIWRERKNYDAVFVHMNKEYVVLGGLFWRLWGKKIILWYNHPQGTLWARFAGSLAHTILFTSGYSFFSTSSKAKQMPVGVDTDVFKREPGIIPDNAVLSIGRIAPVKNIDVLIDAAKTLQRKGRVIPIHIYGSALPKDKEYYKDMRALAEPHEKKNLIIFHGPISNNLTPAVYEKFAIFVNLTPSGSFDKTIIEAMASECIVVASNQSFKDAIPSQYHDMLVFEERNPYDLAEKIEHLIGLSSDDRGNIGRELRSVVERDHSLKKLSDELYIICTK